MSDPAPQAGPQGSSIDRVRQYQFQPGQSGNPAGGRNPEWREAYRRNRDVTAAAQVIGEQALMTLVRAMTARHSSWPNRLAAAQAILDRGFGKATQSATIDQTVTVTVDHAPRIAALYAQAIGLATRTIEGEAARIDGHPGQTSVTAPAQSEHAQLKDGAGEHQPEG